jgi:hypothetical protein
MDPLPLAGIEFVFGISHRVAVNAGGEFPFACAPNVGVVKDVNTFESDLYPGDRHGSYLLKRAKNPDARHS